MSRPFSLINLLDLALISFGFSAGVSSMKIFAFDKSDTACVTLGQSSSDNFPVLILSWLILPIEEINLDDN